MSENQQEQSEAKLLAYIEGDLDAAARVEIEKHLEANPHHRRMLDELGATRDLVRFLPKEPAPPELLETFQGHLERSELLSTAEPEPSVMRINRWPQFRAAAAILVLASGLGAVVLIALPKKQPVAISQPSQPTTLPALVESGTGSGGETLRDKTGNKERDSVIATADRRHEAKGGFVDERRASKVVEAGPVGTVERIGKDGRPIPEGHSPNELAKGGPAGPDIDAASLAQLEEDVMANTVRNAWSSETVRNSLVNYGTARVNPNGTLPPNDPTGQRIASARGAPTFAGGGAGRGGPGNLPAGGGGGAGALPPSGGATENNVGANYNAAGNYGNPLFVVVAAPDLGRANQEVTGYLDSEKLPWDNVDSGTVRELDRVNKVTQNGDLPVPEAIAQSAAIQPAPAAAPTPPPAPAVAEAPATPAPTAAAPLPPALRGGEAVANGTGTATDPGGTESAKAKNEAEMRKSALPAPAVANDAGARAGGAGGTGVGGGGVAARAPATLPADAPTFARGPDAGKVAAAAKPASSAGNDGNLALRPDQPGTQGQTRGQEQSQGGFNVGVSQSQTQGGAVQQQRLNSQYANNRAAQVGNVMVTRMTRGQALAMQDKFNRPSESQRAQVFEQAIQEQFQNKQQAEQQTTAAGGAAVPGGASAGALQQPAAATPAPGAPAPATPPAAQAELGQLDRFPNAQQRADGAKYDAERAFRATTQPTYVAARDRIARDGQTYRQEAASLKGSAAGEAHVGATPTQQQALTPPPVPAVPAGPPAVRAPGAGGSGAATAPPAPRPLVAEPTSPAGQQVGQAVVVPAPAPGVEPAPTVPATTQPATAPAVIASDDQPVDVVIVVQTTAVGVADAIAPNAAAAAPTTPTTNPTAAVDAASVPPSPGQPAQQQQPAATPAPPPAATKDAK